MDWGAHHPRCALRQAQTAAAYARRTGEHISVNFQGYIEGALRSGYRCAAEITGG